MPKHENNKTHFKLRQSDKIISSVIKPVYSSMRITDLNISVLTTRRGYTKLYHSSLIYEKIKGNFIVTSLLTNLMVEL